MKLTFVILLISLVIFTYIMYQRIEIACKTDSGKIDFPTSINYRIIKPDKPRLNYPLLVMLHGTGERGNDNIKPIKALSINLLKNIANKYETYILIPQCNQGNYWIQKKESGIHNFNTFNLDTKKSKNIESVEKIIEKIISLAPIDTSRIYCMGHSMGGGGTVALAIRNPNKFAAITPISCAVDHYNTNQFAQTPALIVIGEKDPFFSIEQIDSLTNKVNKIKDAEIKLKVIKNANHNIYRDVVEDNETINWIFQHKK